MNFHLAQIKTLVFCTFIEKQFKFNRIYDMLAVTFYLSDKNNNL